MELVIAEVVMMTMKMVVVAGLANVLVVVAAVLRVACLSVCVRGKTQLRLSVPDVTR